MQPRHRNRAVDTCVLRVSHRHGGRRLCCYDEAFGSLQFPDSIRPNPPSFLWGLQGTLMPQRKRFWQRMQDLTARVPHGAWRALRPELGLMLGVLPRG